MIIKRFLYILLSLSLFIASTAEAGNNTTITFAVMNDEDGISFTTSFLPDSRIQLLHADEATSGDVYSFFHPEAFPDLVISAKNVIQVWNKEKAYTQHGFYTGDLFDSAYEKEYLELNAQEVELLCFDVVKEFLNNKKTGTEISSETDMKESVVDALWPIISELFDQETTVCISTFDKQYLSVELVRSQNTIFTVSADISKKESFILLIGRRTADAVYYEEINCKRNNDEIDYLFSLFRSEMPVFKGIGEQDCLQFAEIRCRNTINDGFVFEGEIQSILLPSTANIRGRGLDKENKMCIICAEIEIEGQAQNIIDSILPAFNNVLQP